MLHLQEPGRKFPVIEQGAFSGLENLVELNIWHLGHLTGSSAGIFAGLGSLRTLSMRSFSEGFTNETFIGLEGLTSLVFEIFQQGWRTAPPQVVPANTLALLPNLEHVRLQLQFSFLALGPGRFAPLAQLRTLSISFSDISKGDPFWEETGAGVFQGLANLEELTLVSRNGQNRHTRLRAGLFTDLQNIRILDIDCTVEYVEEGTFDGVGVKLDLVRFGQFNNNNVRLDAGAFRGLESLPRMEMVVNQRETYRSFTWEDGLFSGMKNLTSLLVKCNNAFSCLDLQPAAFEGASKLQELVFDFQGIAALMVLRKHVFRGLWSLERLSFPNQ
eukprot:2187827-Rhodomonas_salina.1